MATIIRNNTVELKQSVPEGLADGKTYEDYQKLKLFLKGLEKNDSYHLFDAIRRNHELLGLRRIFGDVEVLPKTWTLEAVREALPTVTRTTRARVDGRKRRVLFATDDEYRALYDLLPDEVKTATSNYEADKAKAAADRKAKRAADVKPDEKRITPSEASKLFSK